jgi:hypothetical protein
MRWHSKTEGKQTGIKKKKKRKKAKQRERKK